jgi:hypothetical protein
MTHIYDKGLQTLKDYEYFTNIKEEHIWAAYQSPIEKACNETLENFSPDNKRMYESLKMRSIKNMKCI